MASELAPPLERREFIKLAGASAICSIAPIGVVAAQSRRIAVVLDSNNPIASSAPVKWAAGRLREALLSKSASCEVVGSLADTKRADFLVAVAGLESEISGQFPGATALPDAPESLLICTADIAGKTAILVVANDVLGFNYGLLEIAARVRTTTNLEESLYMAGILREAPANEVRAIGRFFCCELEDKPWYYDREFWRGYLDTLIESRFNRFNFGFGLEYDFPRGVTGDYFHFPYPYLIAVPGYANVRVLQLATPGGKRLSEPIPLSEEERNRNMEALRFIAAETGARGLHFQLGIWTHAYEWTDSPNAYHRIEGLTPETHAQYCRDALAILLRECPQIKGLTLRVHGESGIPEGSYPFWKTVFEAIADAGRTLEIEMHAKGVNQTMIDMAVATGMPVKLGAKYSAEHQSLGYNQADIRALEIPRADHQDAGVFSLSGGSRLFTRYGYADFLKKGSSYRLLYRLWPGTQRHLLSADPEMAAAYARTAHFCGAAGIDIMEPLTFKGREGSGNPGGRCAYLDTTLNPRYDWQKFEHFYRIWGRHLYNPDADPETWRRHLRAEFGAGVLSVEVSLANASRLLPALTSAHLPSASNHAFWPEIYDNMPIVLGSEPSPYGDTPEPKCFGTVSPLDPQMFSTIVEYVGDLLSSRANPKYSPIEVAQWMEDCSAAAREALDAARSSATAHNAAPFRRIEEDVLIQIGLGQFFAAKLRSGVLYEIYSQSGNRQAGEQALALYKQARTVWTNMAQRAAKVYQQDISYGSVKMRRGNWNDRLPDLDRDIAAMEAKLSGAAGSARDSSAAAEAVQAALARPSRPMVKCEHIPPQAFQPGQPFPLLLRLPADSGQGPETVALYYRHVDQAERWKCIKMVASSDTYSATIPGDYTAAAFALQYYFVLSRGKGIAWMYPGFNKTVSNQPYWAVPQKA